MCLHLNNNYPRQLKICYILNVYEVYKGVKMSYTQA